ncbi:hypothetical protein CGRA01v4_02114 [Colletotrichum graminicola]|nr:hypothetical protein CGRA01v4_02114 [Colletotrichum graminicola]
MASLRLSVDGRTQTTWIMGRQLLTITLQAWWRCLVPTAEPGISRAKESMEEERTRNGWRFYRSVHSDPDPAAHLTFSSDCPSA